MILCVQFEMLGSAGMTLGLKRCAWQQSFKLADRAWTPARPHRNHRHAVPRCPSPVCFEVSWSQDLKQGLGLGLRAGPHILRSGSVAKVQAECKPEDYRISECPLFESYGSLYKTGVCMVIPLRAQWLKLAPSMPGRVVHSILPSPILLA